MLGKLWGGLCGLGREILCDLHKNTFYYWIKSFSRTCQVPQFSEFAFGDHWLVYRIIWVKRRGRLTHSRQTIWPINQIGPCQNGIKPNSMHPTTGYQPVSGAADSQHVAPSPSNIDEQATQAQSSNEQKKTSPNLEAKRDPLYAAMFGSPLGATPPPRSNTSNNNARLEPAVMDTLDEPVVETLVIVSSSSLPLSQNIYRNETLLIFGKNSKISCWWGAQLLKLSMTVSFMCIVNRLS